jgi:hypothetical protein
VLKIVSVGATVTPFHIGCIVLCGSKSVSKVWIMLCVHLKVYSSSVYSCHSSGGWTLSSHCKDMCFIPGDKVKFEM